MSFTSQSSGKSLNQTRRDLVRCVVKLVRVSLKSCCFYLRCDFLIHDPYRQHYCKFTDQRHPLNNPIIFTSVELSQTPFTELNGQFILLSSTSIERSVKMKPLLHYVPSEALFNKNCLVFILTPFSVVIGHVMDECMGLPKEKYGEVSKICVNLALLVPQVT